MRHFRRFQRGKIVLFAISNLHCLLRTRHRERALLNPKSSDSEVLPAKQRQFTFTNGWFRRLETPGAIHSPKQLTCTATFATHKNRQSTGAI